MLAWEKCCRFRNRVPYPPKYELTLRLTIYSSRIRHSLHVSKHRGYCWCAGTCCLRALLWFATFRVRFFGTDHSTEVSRGLCPHRMDKTAIWSYHWVVSFSFDVSLDRNFGKCHTDKGQADNHLAVPGG